MDHTSQQSITTAGKGVIDFRPIFAQANQAGLKHFFAEHDNPPQPMQFVQDSYAFLKQLRY